MSQHTDDPNVDPEEPDPAEPQSKGVRQRMKQLEEEAAAGREAARKLAFIEAGLDLTDPKVKYFVKGFDGEVKAEVIRQAATEAGFIAPPAPATPPDEQEGLARMTQIAVGGSAPPATTDWVAEINKAQTPAQVKAVLAKARAAGA